MLLTPPPLSLYIHTPWCVRLCPYCDFNSHVRETLPEQAYLDALLADLDQDLPWLQGRQVESVFIGGGTPSLMSAGFYQRLFQGIRARLTLSANAEITLEANPGTLEAGRFAGFRQAGINRLSIGVQSFNDHHLQALGRIHDSDQARQAITQARQAGFDNLNLDIMHALPGQTPAQALADLDQALELGPNHLSWYELTIEPNTVFFRAPPTQPDTDTMADTEILGLEKLVDAGFRRYEVSAFAQQDRECRHNRHYWQFGDYLGIGAGAHGKLTDATDQRIYRYQKTRKPEDYMATAHPRRHWQALPEQDALFEALLNGLRQIDGVDMNGLARATGVPADTWQAPRQRLVQQGLLQQKNGRLACTPMGLRHLNGVLGKLAEML